MRGMRTLAALAAMPILVAAKEPVKLAPTSKWVVEYADDSCRLLRTFGAGDQSGTLILERIAPGDSMTMLVVGAPFQASSFARDFEAVWLPDAKAKSFRGVSAKTEDGRQPAILWSAASFQETVDMKVPTPKMRAAMNATLAGERPPKIDLHARMVSQLDSRTNATRATALEIRRRGSKSIVLDTGSMGTPNKMMDDCARNQLRNWGIDPEVDEKIVQRPWGNLLQTITSADYPRESLWKGRESVLAVRLLVDAKGTITKCTALTPVADDAFPKAVCAALMARGKLNPAELADGTPVASYYLQRVRFQAGR